MNIWNSYAMIIWSKQLESNICMSIAQCVSAFVLLWSCWLQVYCPVKAYHHVTTLPGYHCCLTAEKMRVETMCQRVRRCSWIYSVSTPIRRRKPDLCFNLTLSHKHKIKHREVKVKFIGTASFYILEKDENRKRNRAKEQEPQRISIVSIFKQTFSFLKLKPHFIVHEYTYEMIGIRNEK